VSTFLTGWHCKFRPNNEGVDITTLPLKDILGEIKKNTTVKITLVQPESADNIVSPDAPFPGTALTSPALPFPEHPGVDHRPQSIFVVNESEHADGDEAEVAAPRVISLSTADGQSLGLKIAPNASGVGLCLGGCEEGGQAEATGMVQVGDTITHVNGVDISAMPLPEILAEIKKDETVTFTLVQPQSAASDATVAATGPLSQTETVRVMHLLMDGAWFIKVQFLLCFAWIRLSVHHGFCRQP
jgi:hypothetical protein